MNDLPPKIPTEQECLQACRRGDVGAFRTLVDRYVSFVYSAALRKTRNPTAAEEVTRATLLVLARRARRLRSHTVLADWLHRITTLSCRKLPRAVRPRPRRWFHLARRAAMPPESDPMARISGELDRALDRLPASPRRAILLRVMLHFEAADSAGILRINQRRLEQRLASGLRKLAKQLRRSGLECDAGTLPSSLAILATSTAPPEGLAVEIVRAVEGRMGRRPAHALARRALNALAWTRWRRRIIIGVPTLMVCLALALALAWHLDKRTGHSRFLAALIQWSARHEARTNPGLRQPARPWPTNDAQLRPVVAAVRTGADFYRTTNIWPAHLSFSREQWQSLQPRRIGPLPHFFQPDGTVLLRNPAASRSGLAGVLGFDFEWGRGEFEIDGRRFTNVAARFKGNGTYLTSLGLLKQSYKVDVNKFTKGQRLGALDEFNFHNLIDDRSYLSDVLAYEFFREAGVPAPRTAYAYLSLTVAGKWERKPLGLYAMVEPVNGEFARERFGAGDAPIFKPVTYQLFEHLGDHWTNYAAIYDLKTRATEKQKQRVLEFARLVSFADDTEFATRLAEFLDLDEFARFLAGEVLLSCYDSIFANGQNFYVYLDPRSNRFGFIPWDLDLAWGGFFLLGTSAQRERASIWHPWVGEHRFLERVMAVEEFRQLYRTQLEDLSARLFVPERLNRRIDELASILREPIATESDFRLKKFELAVSDRVAEQPANAQVMGANRPVHQLKVFIRHRAKSVRDQLAGKSKGIILERPSRR